jgi:hypothetical protein
VNSFISKMILLKECCHNLYLYMRKSALLSSSSSISRFLPAGISIKDGERLLQHWDEAKSSGPPAVEANIDRIRKLVKKLIADKTCSGDGDSTSSFGSAVDGDVAVHCNDCESLQLKHWCTYSYIV